LRTRRRGSWGCFEALSIGVQLTYSTPCLTLVNVPSFNAVGSREWWPVFSWPESIDSFSPPRYTTSAGVRSQVGTKWRRGLSTLDIFEFAKD